MSSHAVPDRTAVGLRTLLIAVLAYRLEHGVRRTRRSDRIVGEPLLAAPAPSPDEAPRVGDLSAAEAPEDGPGGAVWALVVAAQGGDPEAFGRLYDRYVALVYRYAYHRLGDRSTAEDITSETFLRALRRIGTLQYQGRDVGAWFVTIARNLVLDHLKSGRTRLEVVTAELPEPAAGDRPEATVLARLANASLLRCVRQLNPEQQECVVLRFLNGMSVAETAEIMGKNEGAIKALQHRAIRRLATLLPEDPR
jgi:RNA polymerase sigma-70 factor (TIGR02952 family)